MRVSASNGSASDVVNKQRGLPRAEEEQASPASSSGMLRKVSGVAVVKLSHAHGKALDVASPVKENRMFEAVLSWSDSKIEQHVDAGGGSQAKIKLGRSRWEKEKVL
jgi:hypothetical protein